MRKPRVAGEKGVGAEHERGIRVVGERRHDAVVQRRGIEEHLDAGERRQNGAAGQAEGVKHRQRVEHDVRRAEVDARRHLIAVRLNVDVAERYALGRALCARREQNDRLGVGVAGPGGDDVGQPRSKQSGYARELVEQREPLAHILEIHHADARFPEGGHHVAELGDVDEASRAVDGPEHRRAAP